MIAREILTYLVEQPGARDTMEGIIRWWVPEQKIRIHITTVKDVIAKLVASGLILEQSGLDSRIHYRINRDKINEIRDFVRNRKAQMGKID